MMDPARHDRLKDSLQRVVNLSQPETLGFRTYWLEFMMDKRGYYISKSSMGINMHYHAERVNEWDKT